MLLSFRFKNFRSFRDEQEFSMVASNLRGPTEPLIETSRKDLKVLPVAAVYGANASGKTNLLAALHFMAKTVRASFRNWTPGSEIPVELFGLDPETAFQPARFEVNLLLDGVRFQYGFVLDPSRVLEEWLYAFPEGRRQLWFSREHRDKTEHFKFGKNLAGPNQTVRDVTRENSLFLSAAAQNNHAQVSPIYRWFQEDLDLVWGDRSALVSLSAKYLSAPGLRQSLLELLTAADLGITNIAFEEVPDRGLQQLFRSEINYQWGALEEALAAFPKSLKPLPGRPRANRSYAGGYTVAISHCAGADKPPVVFGMEEESEGTRTLLGLAWPIFRCLERGGVLLIDELEASLHPLLARELIRLFSRPESNPRGAQLIFNTHDTNLLDPELLRRDQIWFCEKDREGASRLYPLSDFRPRRMENVERGYLQGRYGAIPFLGFSREMITSESKEEE